MASKTGPVRSPRYRSHTDWSAASIASRSAGATTLRASVTKLGKLEGPIGALDERPDPGFRPGEVCTRLAEAFDTFLEKLERGRQLDVLALELADDGLEACQP